MQFGVDRRCSNRFSSSIQILKSSKIHPLLLFKMLLLSRLSQLKSTRHYFSSYILVNFIVGLPFVAYGTYVIFQLQQIGFVIGHGVDEPTCMTSCIVPFGSSELDMNAVILYLNAMGFAFGGFIMIFVAALADYWKQKSLLMVITIFLYAAISIPVAWLDKLTKPTFDAFSGLYVLFSVITLALMALLNIYIPFCMKLEPDVAKEMGSFSVSDETERRHKIGTKMSVFGPILSWSASILVLIIGIILSKTLELERQQSAGLIMTTVAGFVTLIGSAVAYFGLPTLVARDLPVGKSWWSIAFSSVFGLVKDLWKNKTAALLLVGYTAYTDTTFAQSTVLSQLFILTVKPDIVEFSLYSLSFNAMCIIFSLIWFWIRPRINIRLRSWMIFGYLVNLIPALWGSIGISENVGIGFKVCTPHEVCQPTDDQFLRVAGSSMWPYCLRQLPTRL
ncbi:hypothetical protein, variant 1 [Exophiala mesophila]|uniref:Autophagy-related protein n=1 Tax=Exophiala mesophila TaxID=212818 RepID=A0A0D1Z5F5_EXOME|nr:hypothetical protein, variant 1 [Exophiala mesophila]KIV89129.1 hypothetical protein, variant 1 [Exophiala mesophila]